MLADITTINQFRSLAVSSKQYILTQILELTEVLDNELSEIRTLLNSSNTSYNNEGDATTMVLDQSVTNVEGGFWYDYLDDEPCLKLRHGQYDFIYKYDIEHEEDTNNNSITLGEPDVSIIGTASQEVNGGIWYELTDEDIPIIYFYENGFKYGIKPDLCDYKGLDDTLIFYLPCDVDAEDTFGHANNDANVYLFRTWSVNNGKALVSAGNIIYDNILIGGQDFTISFYASTTCNNSGSIIPFTLRAVSNDRNYFDFALTNRIISYIYFAGNTNYKSYSSSEYRPTLEYMNNTMYHYAMVYQHDLKRILYFVNGHKVLTVTDGQLSRFDRKLELQGNVAYDEFKIYDGKALWTMDFVVPIKYTKPEELKYLYSFFVVASNKSLTTNASLSMRCTLDYIYGTNDIVYLGHPTAYITNNSGSIYCLEICSIDNNWTFECFVYAITIGPEFNMYVDGNRNKGIHIYPDNITVYYSDNTSSSDTTSFNTVSSFNTWHHIAITWNASTKKLKYYDNGNLIKVINITNTVSAYAVSGTTRYYLNIVNRSVYTSNYVLTYYIAAARTYINYIKYTDDSFIPPIEF